jgi:transposase-like protein
VVISTEPSGLSALDRVLRTLKARDLSGTQLVISDAHSGLKTTIAAVLLGAAWQRSSADISTRRDVPVGHLRRRERTLAA